MLYQRVEVQQRPEQLRSLLGIEFYELDDDLNPRTLRDFRNQTSCASLDKLVRQIADKLESLAAGESQQIGSEPQPESAVEQTNQRGVFLAEASDHLNLVRNQILSFLTQNGIAVYPDQ